MFDFPTSPTLDQTYTDGNNVYRYNGYAWTPATAYAAPLDALAYNGMQVNGLIDVSQERGLTALAVPSGGGFGYIVDCWQYYKVGTMALSVAQVADAPSGLSNSIKLTVTTAKASLAAGEQVIFWTSIEGYRIGRLAWGTASASPITFVFWSKIHRTGMYSGVVNNAATDRNYAFTFTQSVADVWEYKTVTIPGDTSGVWNKYELVGMSISFCVAAHSALLGTAGAWTATALAGATSSINGVAATSDIFQITGLTILPGSYAPTAAQSPLIMRPYDQELVMCKRYYQKPFKAPAIYIISPNGIAAGARFDQSDTLGVEMRASPTMSFANVTYSNAAGLTAVSNSSTQICSYITTSGAGMGYCAADVILDARL